MKGIKKIHLTAIALAVAQFACTTAYAATSSTQEEGMTARMVFEHPQCLPGDGNSFLSASPQTTVNTEAQKQQLAVAYVKELQYLFGFTPMQAAGIVANLLWESGLNSGMKGNGSLGEEQLNDGAADGTGYGVAQWIKDRKAKLVDLAKKMKIPTSSQCANFNFLGNELLFEPRFAKVISAVHAENDLVGAVCSFEKLYQAPKDPNSSNRIELARNIMNWLGEHYVEGYGTPSADVCDHYPVKGFISTSSPGPGKDKTKSRGSSPGPGKDKSKSGGSSPSNIRGPGPIKVTKPETNHGPIPVDPDGKICKWKVGPLEKYGPCPINWPSNEDSPPKQENGPGPGPDHDHQQHVWKNPFGIPPRK
ncbi:phage tail tip lysozyme [Herbaspirillum sp. ST 5-3]|uniref:phage tail tip lysozyme n=1 Tax=Oxalobacteraceae TaxID=75682 RepID=UPI0010A552B2|nr:phage tail tip lysozyme [Herbaspirillum sp. ST 5-3]